MTVEFPISTFGGLKARGNPAGATGVYQIVEVTSQLRGSAGDCQVVDARIGMAQSLGGSGATRGYTCTDRRRLTADYRPLPATCCPLSAILLIVSLTVFLNVVTASESKMGA